MSKKKKKIKNMNSKMTTNSQLSTTEPKTNKNKNSANDYNRCRIREMGTAGKVSSGAGRRKMWEKVQEIRSIICM